MYRVILKTATAEHLLANGGAARGVNEPMGPEGWDYTSGTDEQIVKPIRGAHGHPINRGNEISRISFSASIEFASLRAAGDFALTYRGTLPRKGSLVVISQGEGAAPLARTIERASIPSLRLRPVGRTVVITYTITGGALE